MLPHLSIELWGRDTQRHNKCFPSPHKSPLLSFVNIIVNIITDGHVYRHTDTQTHRHGQWMFPVSCYKSQLLSSWLSIFSLLQIMTVGPTKSLQYISNVSKFSYISNTFPIAIYFRYLQSFMFFFFNIFSLLQILLTGQSVQPNHNNIPNTHCN